MNKQKEINRNTHNYLECEFLWEIKVLGLNYWKTILTKFGEYIHAWVYKYIHAKLTYTLMTENWTVYHGTIIIIKLYFIITKVDIKKRIHKQGNLNSENRNRFLSILKVFWILVQKSHCLKFRYVRVLMIEMKFTISHSNGQFSFVCFHFKEQVHRISLFQFFTF